MSLNFDNVSSASSIALSFTESPMFISPLTSDDSTYPSANQSYDGVLEVTSPLPSGFWTQPAERLRGGYRFLTIVSTSDDPVTISNVSCAISFAPHISNLRDYSGYFFASDPVCRCGSRQASRNCRTTRYCPSIIAQRYTVRYRLPCLLDHRE